MSDNQNVTKRGNGQNPFFIILAVILGIFLWIYFDKQSFDDFVSKLINSAIGLLALALIIFAIAFLLKNSFKKF